MIVVDEAVSKTLLSIEDAISAVEQALVSLHTGDGKVFPVVHGRGPRSSSSFSIKSGIIPQINAVGLKIGSYWPGNSEIGVPTHSSTVLLLDPRTGYPLALISQSSLNALRTAAANALAVRCLARPAASTLGVVGAGNQAWFECMAVRKVRAIKSVLIWNRDRDKAVAFAKRLRVEERVTAETAPLSRVAGADIVVTVTASNEALVDPEWLNPGAHVSAMGADAVGKREIGRPYPAKARLFADLASQSREIGEFQGLADPITDLGAVLRGAAPGRLSTDEITLFDSSGLAVQDLAIAAKVLELVQNRSAPAS